MCLIKLRNIIGLVTISFAFYSCTKPIMYFPNTTTTQVLKEKGDINLSGSLGTNGFETQGTYTYQENIGVISSLNYYNGKNQPDSTIDSFYQLFSEIGLGYNFPLKSDNVILSSFIGIGVGDVKRKNKFNQHKGTYLKQFIQLNFGYHGESFDIYLINKVSNINFIRWKSSYKSNLNDNKMDFKYDASFNEFLIHIALGNNDIKFFLQNGFSLLMNGDYDNLVYSQFPLIWVGGINIKFNPMKSKKKNPEIIF